MSSVNSQPPSTEPCDPPPQSSELPCTGWNTAGPYPCTTSARADRAPLPGCFLWQWSPRSLRRQRTEGALHTVEKGRGCGPASLDPRTQWPTLRCPLSQCPRSAPYLSDGITEDLCTALTQVRGLRVPARTSYFAFKGKTHAIRKIGLTVHRVKRVSSVRIRNRFGPATHEEVCFEVGGPDRVGLHRPRHHGWAAIVQFPSRD